MTPSEAESGTLRATEHLIMARKLRVTAAKLKTNEARDKLLQLATLYEQLSVCYLDEDIPDQPSSRSN